MNIFYFPEIKFELCVLYFQLVRVHSPYIATSQLLPTVPALNPYATVKTTFFITLNQFYSTTPAQFTVFGNGSMTPLPIKAADVVIAEEQHQAVVAAAATAAAQWATAVTSFDEKQADLAQSLVNLQYAAATGSGGNMFLSNPAALAKITKHDNIVSSTRISPVLLKQNARRFTPY
ncbi:unnamed protein product [Thelazia callipaeda]|uniref:PE domain-containing protein n=1 Tax=Thelazia callipaeda TaxID=103827 RepID=A0A0N5D452_THECL|nr:unnamed protein product [Thelazia callipaeda]